MGGAGKTAIVVSGVFGEGGKRGMGGFQWFVQRLCLMTCVELRAALETGVFRLPRVRSHERSWFWFWECISINWMRWGF